MATIHTWEKYELSCSLVQETVSGNISVDSASDQFHYVAEQYLKTYIDPTTGNAMVSFLADGVTTVGYSVTTNSVTTLAGKLSGKWFTKNATDISDGNYNMITDCAYYSTGEARKKSLTYTKTVTAQASVGALVETVTSSDSAAYPQNGAQDGYWYVYAGYEETTGLYATIDGVQRKLTSIPAMVDGVQRELSSLLATVDGVAREIFHVSLVIEFVITHLSTTGDGAKQSTTYYAEKGMTFGEWLESEYNTDGFFYNSSLGFICNSSNNAGLFYYPTYDGIPLDEVIESGSEYYLYN